MYRIEPSINGRYYWHCRCECKNECDVLGTLLNSEKVKSCGCLQKEILTLNNKSRVVHGKRYTRIYRIWENMKNRCCNENHIEFYNYGGRGIKVCNEWATNFQSFYNWAITSGYSDNLTIDRIDNDKDYCPNNCRWATMKQQVRNRSNTLKVNYNGIEKPLAEWCEKLDMNYDTVRHRISRYKWSVDKALSTATRRRFK